jgi:hypothetical protein
MPQVLLIIIAAASFLTSIGTLYLTYFRQPAKLKILNSEIKELTATFNKLKNETQRLGKDWTTLKEQIDTGTRQLQKTKEEKEKKESAVSYLETKLIELKKTTESADKVKADLEELEKERKKLSEDFEKVKSQLQELKINASQLSERKTDLEKENSHLSLEIAKKKITYGTTLKKYTDETGDKRAIKYIGYNPNNHFRKDCFPFVSMPQPNSIIKFPRKGKIGQRGYTEPRFEEHLKTYFFRQRNMQFFIDRFLIVSDRTKPFEPDFVLIEEKENLNLFIDIEIDEPYDGVGRFATHFKGQDNYRNQYFNDRGWIVIRFSEKQVHQNPKGCCRHIADVIKSVNSNLLIPTELQNSPTVQEELFWTKAQAEKWAKENYREKYLGDVTFTESPKIIADTENLIQNETEKLAEKKVAPIKLEEEKLKGTINELNRHHRDSRIKFFPQPHIYLIDDNPNTISASTLVKRFFEDFDEEHWAATKARQRGVTTQTQKDEWEANRKNSADLGTQLHLEIEKYFESNKTIKPHNKPEFDYFIRFYEKHLLHLKLYRTEWRIFDDLINVAGTADMIFKKDDGTYAIYDWKRSKDIKEYNNFNNGIGVCSDLDDCNYNHYCLQLNIYKKILEDHYAKPVSEMYFVRLHPNFDDYKIFPVPNMREKVDNMFDALAN